MANNDQNDNELNEYLNGKSDVSKAYRASNTTEPATHLDEKILSVAKEAVENKKQKTSPKFHKAPWVKPVSIAAIVTLSVSLVVTMQQETGQPLISEPKNEIFYPATVIEDPSLSESIMGADDASVMGEIELKKNKDGRIDVLAPATLDAAAGRYRADEKMEAPKPRMKAVPAKKMLSKEKSQLEALEKRVLMEEQVMPAAPTGVEFDDVMGIKQDRDFSTKVDELLRIKSLWEEGHLIQAKQSYDDFKENYPEYNIERIKEIIGDNVYNGLLDF
jgi:hypothetical protein